MTRIEHVSDTARWVAMYRAMESERPDALFQDPYARRLAGPEGEALLEAVPRGRQSAWAMIVRTAVMDELILGLVRRDGVEQVVNLAAGLDTRPWRMDLPRSLRWVEVDYPDLLAYKGAALAGETPACELETVALDLSDREGRRALFARLAGGPGSTLIVSEGLLIYLEPDRVAELADDLLVAPAFRWWLIDLASPKLLRWMRRSYGRGLDPDRVAFRFAPEEGPAFFTAHGWHAAELRPTMEEAHRLDREMRGAWVPRLIGRLFPNKAEEFRRMAMTVLLGRDGAAGRTPAGS